MREFIRVKLISQNAIQHQESPIYQAIKIPTWRKNFISNPKNPNEKGFDQKLLTQINVKKLLQTRSLNLHHNLFPIRQYCSVYLYAIFM
jgi:hypothetical protein